MDIKTKPNAFFILTFSVLFILISALNLIPPNFKGGNMFNMESNSSIHLSADEEYLVDKIFTFEIGGDPLNLSDILLLEEFTYETFVQLVTPHSCNMTVRIYDPDEKLFTVCDSVLQQVPNDLSYENIPFGTAIAGNHTFSFEVKSIFNVNVLIRIEKKDMCLKDKISEWDPINFVLYEVTRFNTEQPYITHQFPLLSDHEYKFYIGRVSAEGNLSTMDHIDLTVFDPNDLPFAVFLNTSLAGVSEINSFLFGTSQVGTYSIRIEIYVDIGHENLNVAYAMVNKGVIASGEDPTDVNGTIPSDNTRIFLPTETLMVAGMSVGGVMVVIGVMMIFRKRKEAINYESNRD
ncbi:MAG: hypothetical protein MUP85_17635 [Candidatus Lokiarchaeota archaeon]|nr:hypothetical protein [Candidatus Lokiarchaeota archaeon]